MSLQHYGDTARSAVAICVLSCVVLLTAYCVIGLFPPFGFVTMDEAAILASMNLVLMAVYFEFISPKEEYVPKMITSILAVLGGIVALLISENFVVLPWSPYLKYFGMSLLLLLIIAVWLWYEIIFLGSFNNGVERIVDTVPMPDRAEKYLLNVEVEEMLIANDEKDEDDD